MAKVYTGSGGSVDVQPRELAKLLNQLIPTIRRASVKAAKASLIDMREIIQGGIRDNTFGLEPLSPATLATRKMGKLAGQFPSRDKRTGIAPLLASRQTVRGIKVNANTLSLGFDDTATITYSRGNMGKVAAQQEAGFPIRGVYTKKMLAYLHVLFRKQFGKKARIMGEGHTRVGVSYSRSVPARPAWERGTQRSIPKVIQNFTFFIHDELAKKGLV